MWDHRSVAALPVTTSIAACSWRSLMNSLVEVARRRPLQLMQPLMLLLQLIHFDDLNAYGFVELIRGIISSKPNEWQFIISTCEDRLFSLMQKKFARLAGRAIFYEFLGMSDNGPIVEQR